MALNKYFVNQPNKQNDNEQSLYEDLINEAISIRGHNVYYIPRESRDKVDQFLGEDPTSKFEDAYEIEMYVKTTRGFEGDQDFLSKFGLEVRDNIKFLVTGRSFARVIPNTVAIRPREGDLIYSTLFNKMFEIVFAQNDPIFYSLGRRSIDQAYFYELSCETFKFSHEKIETGIAEIDAMIRKNAYNLKLTLQNGTGNFSTGEFAFTGTDLLSASAVGIVANWDPNGRILSLTNTQGQFVAGANVTGATTSTQYNILGLDTIDTSRPWSITDNLIIEDEANNTTITTESNPFRSGT